MDKFLIKQKKIHKTLTYNYRIHLIKKKTKKGEKCTVKRVYNDHGHNEFTDITKCFGAPAKLSTNL